MFRRILVFLVAGAASSNFLSQASDELRPAGCVATATPSPEGEIRLVELPALVSAEGGSGRKLRARFEADFVPAAYRADAYSSHAWFTNYPDRRRCFSAEASDDHSQDEICCSVMATSTRQGIALVSHEVIGSGTEVAFDTIHLDSRLPGDGPGQPGGIVFLGHDEKGQHDFVIRCTNHRGTHRERREGEVAEGNDAESFGYPKNFAFEYVGISEETLSGLNRVFTDEAGPSQRRAILSWHLDAPKATDCAAVSGGTSAPRPPVADQPAASVNAPAPGGSEPAAAAPRAGFWARLRGKVAGFFGLGR